MTPESSSAHYAISINCAEDHAKALGAIERDSKFQVPARVWALVFGFAASEN